MEQGRLSRLRPEVEAVFGRPYVRRRVIVILEPYHLGSNDELLSRAKARSFVPRATEYQRRSRNSGKACHQFSRQSATSHPENSWLPSTGQRRKCCSRQ